MSENTKSNTLNGLFWNAIDRFGNQAMVILVSVIIARIADPSAFAQYSVLLIFSTIASTFVNSGLATSLVRSKEVDQLDYSTMFCFNLTVSISLYLILFFAAPYMEQFYGIKGLALFARVLFLQIVIQSFGIVQNVKILRNFQFNLMMRSNVLAVFLSGGLTILMTYFGAPIWAMILQPVYYATFQTLFMWIWGDWKIDFTFSFHSLKKHLHFSISFMLSNLLGKALSQLYYNFNAKHFTETVAGYYYNGNKWGETPGMLMSSIVQGTTLSTLAPIQDQYARFLNACRKTMSSLVFVLFPVNMFAICVGEPAFRFFLTEKWMPSVVPFQWLCFVGIFIAMTDLNVNFLNIKGKSKFSLILEIIKVGASIITYFLTYKHGIMMIIYGQLVIRFICFIIASAMSGKVYGYLIMNQLKDIIPSFLISVFAAGIAYLPLYYHWVDHDLLLLIIQTSIFAVLYIGINHILKNETWLEILGLVKKKITK